MLNIYFKHMPQENINPAVPTRFLQDAYFARSVAHWPIFLTLNNVVKSPSGCLTAAAGGLFGYWPIFSSNDKIIGRWPTDVQATIARRPGDDRLVGLSIAAGRHESCGHLVFTFWWPCGHRRELHWCGLGSNMKLIFDFHMFLIIVTNFHY